MVEGCWIRVSSYGVYILPNRISPFSCYERVARFWFYLSLFLLPKSLLILSNTVLRGSWIFGLLPLKESWDMTWIIIQSTIFLSLSFLIQSVIPSFTELLNSSGSYIIINSKRDTLSICCMVVAFWPGLIAIMFWFFIHLVCSPVDSFDRRVTCEK